MLFHKRIKMMCNRSWLVYNPCYRQITCIYNKHRTVRAIIGMNFQSAYSCCILNIGSIRVCTENKSYRLNILISKVETEMHFVNKYEGIKPSMINSWKRILKESFP